MRATLQDERSRITFVMPGPRRAATPKEDYFLFLGVPHGRRAEGVCEQVPITNSPMQS